MSKSLQSDISRASQKTQQMMEDISSQNESKINSSLNTQINQYQLPNMINNYGLKTITKLSLYKNKRLFKAQGAINANTLYNIWASLGSMIQKSLKLGRALSIQKIGTFTFSYPEVDQKQPTNSENRTNEIREPVFIISKEFGQGVELKSGVYREKGLRPLALNSVNGKIQVNQLSFNELALLSKSDKDTAQLAIYRIKSRLEQLVKQSRENESVVLEIPCVGTLMIRNGVCAVSFNEFLTMQLQGVFKESIEQRRSKINGLTSLKLKQLEESYKNLDEGAKEWLSKNLNIDTDRDWRRKSFFAKTPDVLSVKSQNEEIMSQFSKTSGITLFQSVKNKAYKSFRESQKLQEQPSSQNVSSIKKPQGLVQTIQNYQILKHFQQLIKDMSLTSEQSFNKIIGDSSGKEAIKSGKLDLKQFRIGLQKMEFYISEAEQDIIFKQIDTKQDGFIDQEEWKTYFSFEKTPVEWVKSVTDNNNFTIEELSKRIGCLSTSQSDLSFQDVVKYLKRLMNCTLIEADKIAKFLLKDKNIIQKDAFLSFFLGTKGQLQQNSAKTYTEADKFQKSNMSSRARTEESSAIDKKSENEDQPEEWLIGIFKKIKRNLNSRVDKDVLANKLQEMDAHNRGYLDVANFKTCLFQCKLGLTLQDIEKINKYIEKVDDNFHIDYSKFLQRVDNSLKISNSKEGIDYVATSILAYIKKNCNNDSHKFLLKLKSISSQNCSTAEGIQLQSFIKAAQQLIFQTDPQQIALFGEVIDIDKDGFIDKFDLETFLKRYSYIEASISHPEESQTQFSKKSEGFKVFPTIELTTDQLQRIIRDFKQHLIDRKISLYDSFKSLDSNNDGFITISELNENLQKNLNFQLSTIAKNGLFSYLDYLKIGMFDYSRWYQVLSRITLSTEPLIIDNFDAQYHMIKEIQNWFIKQNMSPLEAFRIADKDFDGYINKQDLKNFLIENVQANENELSSSNLDRLFKLIDRSKKNHIDKNDFIFLLDSSQNQMYNSGLKSVKSSITTSVERDYIMNDYFKTNQFNSVENDSLNWIKSCIQQISLYFSKLNKNVFEQFEAVSNYKSQVNYARFVSWIEQSDALNGFNLTDKLLQQLFAYLDPHKKGFITLKDWKNCLSSYLGKFIQQDTLTKSDLILQQGLKKLNLKKQRNTILEGFNYLSNGRPTINLLNFSKSLNNLFPGQYTSGTRQKLWFSMIQQIGINATLALKSSIDFEQFCKIFEFDSKEQQIINNSFRSKTMINSSSLAQLGKSNLSNKNVICYEDCEKAFKRFKNLLFISNKNILDEFQKADPTGTGVVTIIEFRNILSNLNLGLNSSEISLITQFIDPISTKTCKYKQFLQNIRVDSNTESILKRSSNRIISLRQALYEYLITPKDAFRQADTSKKGYMNFQDFSKFMEIIADLTQTEQLNFQILKDMFDFIDVKGDGIIDIQEWLAAFMKYEDTRVRKYGYSTHSTREEATQENSIDFKTKGNNYKEYSSQKIQVQTLGDFKQKRVLNPNIKWRAKSTVGSLLNQNNKTNTLKAVDDSKIIKSINDYYTQNSINPTQWEQSQEYDKTQIAIARNRKILLSDFLTAHQNMLTTHEQPKIEIPSEDQNKERKSQSPHKRMKSLPQEPVLQNSLLPTHIVKNIISQLLTSLKISVHINSWQTLLGFAEKQPGLIDYRFLLDIYKDKLQQMESPPSILHS